MIPPALVAIAVALVGLPAGLCAADAWTSWFHPSDSAAIWPGLAAGVVVTAAATGVLAWLRRYRGQVGGAFCASLLMLGIPGGVGVAVLSGGHAAPFEGGVARHKSSAVAEVLGLAVGVVLTAAGTAVIHRRFRRRLGEARRNLEGEIAGLAGDFPLSVAAWGGPGVLHDPAAVQQALQSLGGPAAV